MSPDSTEDPPRGAAPLLELVDVGFAVAGKPILEGIRLTVAAGEMHALLGRNGAGKSTLAELIMGCAGHVPTAGTIRFAGEAVDTLPLHERARRGIALAWQEPARFEGLTVGDYLRIGAAGADPAACLRQVGLEPEDYLPRQLDRTLSGGERKRIELAGVLALRPRLAILDEPTSGIDFLSQEEIAGVVRALRRQGAVLLITHQESLAAGADSASLLCGGRIVCQGAPAAVIARYKTRLCPRCDGEHCHA